MKAWSSDFSATPIPLMCCRLYGEVCHWPLFSWQNTRTNQRTLLHNQKSLETNQLNTQRTLELTEQGQITERSTRAIQQLGDTDDKGNPRLEIRLGGIYSLERISKDSPKDYSQIIDILTAYLRKNSSVK